MDGIYVIIVLFLRNNIMPREVNSMFSRFILIMVLCLVSGLFIGTKSFADNIPLKIGLLPIADTILLIVADEKGFFKERGIDAELIPFQSAVEKDAVAMAGSIDGHFCEIISVIVQRASGKNFKVVATTSYTNPERRMFGLVTSPGHNNLSIKDLKGKDMLNAKRTITDFLTEVFFEKLGLPPDYMEIKDVRKIPVRMQLLLSDQSYATLIPEPMLTVAEKAGGKVLMDDRVLDIPLATVALRGDLEDTVVSAFQVAIADAVTWINHNPEESVDLMVQHNLITSEMRDSYLLPVFDPKVLPYKLPDKELFEKYIKYLKRIEVLKGEANPDGLPVPSYEDVIYQGKNGE
jgi:NitT/TauT family transport system substrate-binding protein